LSFPSPYSPFAIRHSPLLSIPLRLDDFRHGHAELFLHQYHFAAGDQAVVDVDVDRHAYLAVEFDHRAGTWPQQFAHLHARAAVVAALSRLMPPSAHSMRQSPDAMSGSASTTRRLSRPRAHTISSSRARAVSCSASLTRTTTCGVAIRCWKQSIASAASSANGSRAMSSGASFLATATATSIAWF